MAFNAFSDLLDGGMPVGTADGLDNIDTIGLIASPQMKHECGAFRKFIKHQHWCQGDSIIKPRLLSNECQTFVF